MTPERWQRVKSVFQSALERTSAERHAFLGEACSGDLILQADVESLLASHEKAGTFIQEPLLPPPRRLASGDLLGPYQVVRLLGSGGMGDVYLARDPRLEREVALKVLSIDMAPDQEQRKRFLSEARAVSALNHPNICTIHEIGCADGRDYICFEHIQGQRLDALLGDGGLSLERLLGLALPLAEALAYAHGRGILHRGLKPANLMVSDLGIPKVLDFGLAKILPLAKAPVSESKAGQTDGGLVVGTAAYMSPEQALGHGTDERSDVFSFGVVLYEMATGRPAFVGATPTEVRDAVLHAEPEPVARVRPDLPLELSMLVEKVLRKDLAQRYQHMSELAEDLRRIRGPTSSTTRRVGATRPRRLVVRPSLKAAALAAAVAAFVWLALFTLPERPVAVPASAPDEDVTAGKTRVAVLPFENLSRQPDDDWLASAFSDSLTFGLQSFDSLILVSRSGVAQAYRERSLREADRLDQNAIDGLTRTLAVRHYVHGSYQRIGDEVRVVARLVELGTGAIKAQESVTDRFANLLQLEDTLARRFAARLESGGARAHLRLETTSLAAYRAITESRGLYALNRWEAALESSQRAVDLDPDYAEAWALLGKTYARFASAPAFTGGSLEDYRSRAVTAAKRAAELDPSSYEAHVALGLAHREMAQVEPWRAAARRAIALNPRFAEAYALLGDSYSESTAWGCGHDRDSSLAVSYYRRALRIDPSVHTYHINLGQNLKYGGRIEEALRVADEGLLIHPTSRGMRRARGWMLVELGRLDEAEQMLREAMVDGGPRGDDAIHLAAIDLKRGRLEAAAKGFRNAALSRRSVNVARYYIQAGRPGPALDHLEQALRADRACSQWLLTTPSSYWTPIRSDPQARALLERYAGR